MERVIAIGDIHGCSRALETLLDVVAPTSHDTVITLGDVIDRGPDSRGVIEQLIALRDRCTLVPLMGNHEEMFLAAHQGYDVKFWLSVGGREMLESYGAFKEAKDVPHKHVAFLRSFGDLHETAGHFFVHGYYDPDKPLDEQDWKVARWQTLAKPPRAHVSGKIAVVGHTTQRSGLILDLPFLKCIDTFCHGDGWLTALDVVTGQIWQTNQARQRR